MDSRAFYYLVKRMRAAQKDYFKTHNPNAFRTARALEGEIDREIARVELILKDAQETQEK